MIIGAGIFAILIFLVLASRADHNAMFDDRQCGYCSRGIHWNKRSSRWVHPDGNVEGLNDDFPCRFCGGLTCPRFTHHAHPLGTMGGMLS